MFGRMKLSKPCYIQSHAGGRVFKPADSRAHCHPFHRNRQAHISAAYRDITESAKVRKRLSNHHFARLAQLHASLMCVKCTVSCKDNENMKMTVNLCASACGELL
jgi:hypothetical protein